MIILGLDWIIEDDKRKYIYNDYKIYLSSSFRQGNHATVYLYTLEKDNKTILYNVDITEIDKYLGFNELNKTLF